MTAIRERSMAASLVPRRYEATCTRTVTTMVIVWMCLPEAGGRRHQERSPWWVIGSNMVSRSRISSHLDLRTSLKCSQLLPYGFRRNRMFYFQIFRPHCGHLLLTHSYSGGCDKLMRSRGGTCTCRVIGIHV